MALALLAGLAPVQNAESMPWVQEPGPAASDSEAAAPDAVAPTHLGAYQHTITGLPRPMTATYLRSERGTELCVGVAGREGAPAGIVVLTAAQLAPSEEGDTAAPPATLGVGVLMEPTGLASDDSGNLWINDRLLHSVLKIPTDGGDPVLIAGPGTSEGDVRLPSGIAWHGGTEGKGERIAVADTGNRRAQVLEIATGTWTVLAPGHLTLPTGVTFVDHAPGRTLIAVSDRATQRVELFDLDGTHVMGFGAWGFFPSLLSGPGGLQSLGRMILVADEENHRIQVFELGVDSDGTGAPPADADPNEAPLAYRFGVHAIRPGEGAGSLHYPRDLAVSVDGEQLATVEPLDDRVQLFGRAPGAEPAPDTLRAALGQPSAHLGGTCAASGQVLVTVSPESHRLKVYDTRLDKPAKIAEPFTYGVRLGMLRGPSGAWLDQDGRSLLVTDEGCGRLTRSALDIEPDAPLRQLPGLARHLDGVNLDRLADAGPVVPGAVVQWGTGEGTRIAIADRASERVLLLDGELGLIKALSTPTQRGPIRGIGGLYPTPSGTLLVVDGAGDTGQRGGRVHEFNAAGEWLREFGRGDLAYPDSVLAFGDSIWVSDPGRQSIVRFRRTPDGAVEPVDRFGGRGLGKAEFHEPRGLAKLDRERILVIDHGNHRGQIFDLEGNFLTGFGGRLYTQLLR